MNREPDNLSSYHQSSIENRQYQEVSKISKTVLVVDNDSLFVEFLTDLLEAREYRVIKAYDGKEGISKLEQERVDLLFVDMIMPKIDGKQLIKFVHTRFPHAGFPIIALSGVMIEQLDRLEGIGADYFIAKGPMEKMAKHIETLLDKIEVEPMPSASDETIFQAGNLIPRQITDELIQTVNFHRAIIESAGVGIMVLDRDTRIIIAKLLKQELGKAVFSVFINSQQVRIIVSLLKIDGEIAGWIITMEDTGKWAEQA
ncbi:MAG: response regulator [Deltaproteobacteria bacterium]|nr:response regulator [Deltaproteobacteria bacterium]